MVILRAYLHGWAVCMGPEQQCKEAVWLLRKHLNYFSMLLYRLLAHGSAVNRRIDSNTLKSGTIILKLYCAYTHASTVEYLFMEANMLYTSVLNWRYIEIYWGPYTSMVAQLGLRTNSKVVWRHNLSVCISPNISRWWYRYRTHHCTRWIMLSSDKELIVLWLQKCRRWFIRSNVDQLLGMYFT